jgi:1-phosphatidylinositol phosphodiesterase
MHCQCLFLFLLLTITSALDLTKWMSNLPDDLPLTLLSIPGTHNSLAYPKPRKPLIPSTQCQHLKLEQQLSKGVRFLDLRLQHHRDRLTIHHGIQYLSATFTDVLLYLLHFLSTNPSETIIIRAFHNNPRSSKRRNGCTRELWQTVQWYIEQWPEVFCETTWWGEDNTCHGRNAAAGGAGGVNEVSKIPSLGEVRGKCVFLQDFESPYPMSALTPNPKFFFKKKDLTKTDFQ